MKNTFCPAVWVVPLALLVADIGRAQSPAPNTSTNPVEKTKPCFQCDGRGEAKCAATGCRDGRKDCPGRCLKLTVGVWEKREIPGHTDPNERWQRVYFGKKSGYWSSAHVGEVPTLAPDGTFSSPKCPTCHGSATVPCPGCKGQGVTLCPLCKGTKKVPASWSAFDHPKMKDRPRKFQLKDGRTLIGRKVMISGDTVTLRTEQGDVRLSQSEIVSEEAQPTQK